MEESSVDGSEQSSEQTGRTRRYSSTRSSIICSRGKPISHECLRDTPFFKNRDPKFLDVLMETLQVQVRLPGEAIITQGDDGDCLYFLYRGEAEVVVGEHEKQVAILKDGSLFGEMALLGNGKRTATVRALSLCDCRVISAEAFHASLVRFPSEGAFFTKLAKERLAEITKVNGRKHLADFQLKPLDESLKTYKRAPHAVMGPRKSVSTPTPHSEAASRSTVSSARRSIGLSQPEQATPRRSSRLEPGTPRHNSRTQSAPQSVPRPVSFHQRLDNLARVLDAPPAYSRPVESKRNSAVSGLQAISYDQAFDELACDADSPMTARRAGKSMSASRTHRRTSGILTCGSEIATRVERSPDISYDHSSVGLFGLKSHVGS